MQGKRHYYRKPYRSNHPFYSDWANQHEDRNNPKVFHLATRFHLHPSNLNNTKLIDNFLDYHGYRAKLHQCAR